MLQIDVLGPLIVRRDGPPVSLAGAMPARVLAVLLCAGRPVPGAELGEAISEGFPSDRARTTVKTYVHRLRRALGPDRIRHVHGGYRVVFEPAELDATRFAELTDLGRAARDRGDLTKAAHLFDEALGLWRGEPYAELQISPMVAAESLRLVELRLSVIEEKLAVDLDLGHHAERVAELTAAAGEHRFRERTQALLMLALYRTGRQAEALEVYRRTQKCLADELGIDPGAPLQRLHEAVLRGDGRLDEVATQALESGTWLPVVGTRRHRVTGVPRQLPADVAGFAGREAELARLDEMLSAGDQPTASRIWAVSGSAGVGKTTLAVHWAHRVADHFPDGQVYVNLRGFDPTGMAMSSADAVRGLLDAFGVDPTRIPVDPTTQTSLYRSTVAGRRVLVVLDNARDADQIRPLLPGSPGPVAIVTSRNDLTGLVAKEGARPLALDLPSAEEARRLLESRLGADRVTAEPEATADIIAACARLPLALAVVAARAAVHPDITLAGLATELRAARDRLDAFADTLDPAADVRTVFSWSYRRLGRPAARLFRQLATHPGPDISAPAAASLAAVTPAEAHRVLSELAHARLITEHIAGRYAFHDLLRAYADELAHACDPEAERNEAFGRMVDHYMHTAYAAGEVLNPYRDPIAHPLSPHSEGVGVEPLTDRATATAWFTAERTVLFGVLEALAAREWDAPTWRLAWTLDTFLKREGHWHDLAEAHRIGLGAAQRIDDLAAQARGHICLGYARILLQNFGDADMDLRRALDLYEQIGDRAGQARAHQCLSKLLEHRDRPADALVHARRSLHLFRATGNATGQGQALNSIGWFEARLGHHQPALTHCRQALRLFEQLGNRACQAGTWDSLGYAHHHLGEYSDAIVCYRTALDVYREVGEPYGEAVALGHLGDTQQAIGDHAAAQENWRLALDILEQTDHPDTDLRRKLRTLDVISGRHDRS